MVALGKRIAKKGFREMALVTPRDVSIPVLPRHRDANRSLIPPWSTVYRIAFAFAIAARTLSRVDYGFALNLRAGVVKRVM